MSSLRKRNVFGNFKMTTPTAEDLKKAEVYLNEPYVFMGTEQEKLTKSYLAGLAEGRQSMRLSELEQYVLQTARTYPETLDADRAMTVLIEIIDRLTARKDGGEKSEEFLGSIKGETEFSRAERLWRLACAVIRERDDLKAQLAQSAKTIAWFADPNNCRHVNPEVDELIQKLAAAEKENKRLHDKYDLQILVKKLADAEQLNDVLKRTIGQYDDAEDVHENQIGKLQSDVAVLRNALEFYANPDHWISTGRMNCYVFGQPDSDDKTRNTEDDSYYVAGAMAREALKAVAEKEKKSDV